MNSPKAEAPAPTSRPRSRLVGPSILVGLLLLFLLRSACPGTGTASSDAGFETAPLRDLATGDMAVPMVPDLATSDGPIDLCTVEQPRDFAAEVHSPRHRHSLPEPRDMHVPPASEPPKPDLRQLTYEELMAILARSAAAHPEPGMRPEQRAPNGTSRVPDSGAANPRGSQ